MVEETYVFLDFNSKLPKGTFDNDKDAFIRIANLHKKNPLVQVNDTVFKGTYDYAMGTNLFFEAQNDTPRPSDVFVKRGPIHFEQVFNETKIINLVPVKVPPQKIHSLKNASQIEFQLDWDYQTLLEKFSEGSITLSYILKDKNQLEKMNDLEADTNTAEEMDKPIEEIDSTQQIESTEDTNVDKEIHNNVTEDIEMLEQNLSSQVEENEMIIDQQSVNLLENYNKLRQLAFRPMKSVKIVDQCQECDPKFKESYEYHNLEKQILQPSDFFPREPVSDINEETLSDCVDIDRCVLYGILNKSKKNPRRLNEEELRKVLTLDNFDNLSLAARYVVLAKQVDELKTHISHKTDVELHTKDQYGRTPRQTLELYQKLRDAVKKRLEEIKYSLLEVDEKSHIESNINLEHSND